MNTLENNKLIAEFMKWDVKRPSTIPSNLHLSNIELDNGEIFEPLFHSSWDWLIPVVEKIESLGWNMPVAIFWYGTYIGKPNGVNTISVRRGSRINNTYKAVVEFIKFYNENK